VGDELEEAIRNSDWCEERGDGISLCALNGDGGMSGRTRLTMRMRAWGSVLGSVRVESIL
jgi:hypothetical protein